MMDNDEVLSIVNQFVESSIAFETSEVSQQRADAISFYYGEALGNEQEGKSQVVSKDVMETIDWIMPSLMKIFTKGDNVVEFIPQTAEDVPLAEQETAYVDWVFTRKNPGFTILHDFFQDALMVKNGFVKVYLDEEEQPLYDSYSGLSDEMVESVMSSGAELVSLEKAEDGSNSLRTRTIQTRRNIKVCNIPPEEFLIEAGARSIQEATFVAHRPAVTRSKLKSMGVPDEILDDLQYDNFDLTDSSPEVLSRDSFDGNGLFNYMTYNGGEATSKIRLNDCYVNIDVDGDGIAELRHVVTVGSHVLVNEEAPLKPFASITSHRIAHKFFGMSIYDRIKDLQIIRSILMRNILDNVYNVNNGRYACIEGQVNLDDLMSNQTGGIVRIKTQGAVDSLPVPALGSDVYNMLDRTEDVRSKRTGVSDRSRGLDDSTLHSNQAATSVNQLMTASEQQIDMIARMFAETGVKELFYLIHEFAIRYQDQKEVFQLNGKFTEVNPSEWRQRYDLAVKVGIGNTNKDQQLMHLTKVFELTQAVINGGGMGILTNPSKIYNILKQLTINAGFKDVDSYWVNPESPEGQEAQANADEQASKESPEELLAQAELAKAQADAQKKQADAQIEMAKLEIEEQQLAIKSRELAIEEARLELEREKFAWERAKNEAEYHLESSQERPVSLGFKRG